MLIANYATHAAAFSAVQLIENQVFSVNLILMSSTLHKSVLRVFICCCIVCVVLLAVLRNQAVLSAILMSAILRISY